MSDAIDHKYVKVGDDHFIRHHDRLIPVTKDAWEANRAADVQLEQTPEWIAAHGNVHPVRNRDSLTGEPIER